MTAALDHFVAEWRERSSSLPGSRTPWIERMRRLALEQFAERGFPSAHEEEWKYTNVEPIARHGFRRAGAPGASVRREQVDALAFAGEHLLVFVDGEFAPQLSRVGSLPAGTLVANLAEVLERNPERLEPILARSAGDTAFTALNTAFCAQGAVVLAPRGADIASPVHVLYLSTTPDAVVHPRTIVLAETGARVAVIEQYAGLLDAPYFTNAVTQLLPGANASVELYRLQGEGPSAFHVGSLASSQQRDSRLSVHVATLGGAFSRTDLRAGLDAPGCECTLNGLYVAGGKQLVDHHAIIDHAQPHGTSRVFYRGILDGESRGVFAGRVVVQKGAQKTDAHLANHNLLLSRTAEADTKPQLEIYADDVKCGHGTTVGQLDENMLFYLRSRGISRELAGALLTFAFAHDVIGRMPFAPLRERLEQALIERLPEGQLIREAA